MRGGGRRGRDRMVVGCTNNCAVSALINTVVRSNPIHGEAYSIQHYVIKFVNDSFMARRTQYNIM